MISSYPWYIQDWLLSRARAVLNLEERGLFREVLDVLYSNGGLLENDEEIIRRMCGAERSEWKRSWPAVHKLLDNSNESLSHPKVRATIVKIDNHRLLKQKAGKAAAEARWSHNTRIADASSCYDSDEAKNARSVTLRSVLPTTPLPPTGEDKPDPIEEALRSTAVAMAGRHPAVRSCGPKECESLLRKIIAKDKGRVAKIEHLERINENHRGMCDSHDWTKSDGEFAKALSNWLAPTMGRYDTSATLFTPSEPVLRNGADVLRELQALGGKAGEFE